MNFVTKQPHEILPLSLDFAAALPTGQSIDAASTVTAIDMATGLDATASTLTGMQISGTTITTTLIANSVSGRLKVTFLVITTPNSFKIEEEVIVRVQDR